MSTAALNPALPRPSFNLGPIGFASAGIALGASYLTAAIAWHQGALSWWVPLQGLSSTTRRLAEAEAKDPAAADSPP